VFNIIICDDNPAESAFLSNLVQKWADVNVMDIRLLSFESAEAFLFAYEDNKNVDILLLDIQMKKMDGMALARKIREENSTVQIAFITGFADYMAEGYDVSALHYLMKPVNEAKLFETLERAVKNLEKTVPVVSLEINGETVILPTGDIVYIEAIDHFLDIHTANDKITVKMQLYKLEESLMHDFIHCHRSYVVNMKFIHKITRTEVILDSGAVLPLSRRLYSGVNKAMMMYIKGDF